MAEHVTNGFGTVLAGERALLDFVRTLLDAEGGRHTGGITRILQHHIGQIRVIISLLKQRDQLLPFPARFNALDHSSTILKHLVKRLPKRSHQPLTELVKRNQDLRKSIETLIEQSGNRDGNETGLHEAAQRHEDMEWMLAAMVHEDSLRNLAAAAGEQPDANRL